jgi:hypothetical protein
MCAPTRPEVWRRVRLLGIDAALMRVAGLPATVLGPIAHAAEHPWRHRGLRAAPAP